MLYAKFGWNWPSGSGEEDETVKSLSQGQQWRRRQRRRTTDKFWSKKLTWAFGSGELKKWIVIYAINYKMNACILYYNTPHAVPNSSSIPY